MSVYWWIAIDFVLLMFLVWFVLRERVFITRSEGVSRNTKAGRFDGSLFCKTCGDGNPMGCVPMFEDRSSNNLRQIICWRCDGKREAELIYPEEREKLQLLLANTVVPKPPYRPPPPTGTECPGQETQRDGN